MVKNIEISGVEELQRAVDWFEAILSESGRKVVALYGEMGAGKTTFVSGYCKNRGISEGLSSPTFSIVNKYSGDGEVIFHFDCYRFESEREALDIGVFEYFDSGSLCFVEWPERIEGILSECDVLSIKIEAIGNTARKFSIV